MAPDPLLDQATAAVPTASPSCAVTGSLEPPNNEPIYSDVAGQTEVARFTGSSIRIEATLIEGDLRTARVRVLTGIEPASYRFEGFLSAPALHTSATRDLVVARDHVWIAQGTGLALMRLSGGILHVAAADVPELSAETSCEGIVIGPTAAVPRSPPADMVRRRVGPTLMLYAAPGLTPIVTLPIADGEIWANVEPTDGYLRVAKRDLAIVDAWARAEDIGDEIPPGRKPSGRTTKSVKLLSPARRVVAKDTPIRTGSSAESIAVGVALRGAAVTPEGEDGSMTKVSLGDPGSPILIPPPGGEYWIRSADLGLPGP